MITIKFFKKQLILNASKAPALEIETHLHGSTASKFGFCDESRLHIKKSIPHESPKKLQVIPLIAAVNFLQSCFQSFWHCSAQAPKAFEQEFLVPAEKINQKVVNNEERKHILAMIMLLNGQIFAALITKSFSAYICNWARVVHDCFTLRTRNTNRKFVCS